MSVQPFFDEDDDMEMPCVCDCGRVFDLHDGIPHPKKNITICRKCAKKLNDIIALEIDMENAEYDIECGHIGKREGKKKLKTLRQQLKELED